MITRYLDELSKKKGSCNISVFLQVMYLSKYQLNIGKIKAIAGILLSWEQLKWFCNNHFSFQVAQIEKLPVVQKFQWTFITRETNGWGRIQIPQHYGSLYCNPFLVILFVKKLLQHSVRDPFKGTGGLKQKCTQFKAQFFHALSHGVTHFVGSTSSKKGYYHAM